MKNSKAKKILSLLLLIVIALAYPLFTKLTGEPADETSVYTSEYTSDINTVDESSPSEIERTTPYQTTEAKTSTKADTTQQEKISEDGTYTKKEDVALYLHTYGHLPDNFITKNEARNLGWEGGSVERYAPGKAIGGDYYGNYEGTLPQKKGLKYYECDIDTLGKSSRGAKRIIFSNQGDVYYTSDHYETFTKLY